MKKNILTTGLLLVILVVFFLPQLVLGEPFLSDTDVIGGFYPILSFYQHQILSGHDVLWIGGVLGGFPIYLELFTNKYSPLLFLLRFFSVVNAYGLAIFIGMAILLACSYAFARESRMSRTGALLASVVFAFGYHNVHWHSNLPVVNALFILPLLLFSLMRVQKGQYAWILLAGIGTGYALLNGQPQWVLMGFVASGIYAAYVAYKCFIQKSLDTALLAKVCISIAIIAILGAVMTYPHLAASHRLAEMSARSNGLSFSAAQISSQTPIDWLWYIFPLLQIKYLNAAEPTLYIGVLAFVLGVAAAVSLWRKDSHVRFFVILWIFGLLTAFRYSPLFWAIHQLPIFNYFRGANRWMFIGNFGLAMLAGIGFDAVRQQSLLPRVLEVCEKILKWTVYVSVALIAFANIAYAMFAEKIIKFLQNYFDHNLYEHTTKLPLEYYHNAIRSRIVNQFANVNLTNPKFIFAIVMLIAGYIVVRALRHRTPFLERNITGIILGVAILNLLALNPNFYPITGYKTPVNLPETVKFIFDRENENGKPFRTLSVFSGSAIDQKLRTPYVGRVDDKDQLELSDGLLKPDRNLIYGIDAIDGLSNLMPRRLSRVLAILGVESATTGDMLADKHIPLDEKISIILGRLNLLSMLNVKYFVSAYEFPIAPRIRLVHIAHSTRFSIPVYIYENENVMPRVYLANSVTYITETDEEKNFKTIIESDNDFSKRTFVECGNCTQTNNVSGNDKLTINQYKDGYLDLSVDIGRGRWLVFSESNLPGWKITIDGRPARSYMANYFFHGVYIPKGTHNVRFEYGGI